MWRYNIDNMDPHLCTHLIYAYGNLNEDSSIKAFDKYQDIEREGYNKFNGLKGLNKHLKTLLSIGGSNVNNDLFSSISASPKRRKELVSNIIKFLRHFKFDGVNLDWQVPTIGNYRKLEDKHNYVHLIQVLREGFETEYQYKKTPKLILTISVPARLEFIDQGFDIPKINQYVDWINVLTFNYHETSEPTLNHHSSLYSLTNFNGDVFDKNSNIDTTIKHYLKRGANPDKLVLSISNFGRSFKLSSPDRYEIGAPSVGAGDAGLATGESGFMAYFEICENIKNKGWKVERPDPRSFTPYAYKDKFWVAYDDEKSVRKKTEYAVDMGLGGVLFWSIDLDDFRGVCHEKQYPLIQAAKDVLINYADVISTTVNVLETTKVNEPQRMVLMNEFFQNSIQKMYIGDTSREAVKTTATLPITDFEECKYIHR